MRIVVESHPQVNPEGIYDGLGGIEAPPLFWKPSRYHHDYEGIRRLGLRTSRQWKRRGRKPIPRSKPAGILVLPESVGELSPLDIPFYSEEQTRPYTMTRLERAMDRYWEYFVKHANKQKYIWLAGDVWKWCQRRDVNSFRPISEQHARKHILGQEIYGVVGTERTHFIGLDHDLHTGKDKSGRPRLGDPEIFQAQLKVLLRTFHGRHRWHFQVKDQDISGVHAINVLKSARDLATARNKLRETLKKLDEQHPDLAAAARAAGMKTLGELEVFPDPGRGFRLPLARGRVVLLDRALPLVYNARKRCEVQDVCAYIDWLDDPDRKHMPLVDVEEFISARLCRVDVSPTTSTTATTTTKAPAGKAKAPSGLPSFAGACRRKLGEWLGRAHQGQMPAGSLNWLMGMLLRLYFVKGLDTEEAVTVLVRELEAIQDKSFSARLSADLPAVEAKARQMAGRIWRDNGGQPDPALSSDKLRRTLAQWDRRGVDVTRLSTFFVPGQARPSLFNVVPVSAKGFEWTPAERADVESLACVLKCDPDLAGDILLSLVRHIGKGRLEIARKLVPDLLRPWPIKIGKAAKQTAFLAFLVEKGYLEIVQRHRANMQGVMNQARLYGLAERGRQVVERKTLSSPPPTPNMQYCNVFPFGNRMRQVRVLDSRASARALR